MLSIDFSGPEIRQAFFIVSPTVKECEATKKSANGCTNYERSSQAYPPYHLEMLLFLRCNSVLDYVM